MEAQVIRPKKVVTKIEANPMLTKYNSELSLLRVAAYCRVSTDSEDQLESYKAQVAYYTNAIAKNPRWRFVGIYADEGITGTQAKKRDNFMRMIRDCEKGKIDLILTKSVARFARNTVDSLKYTRLLRSKGVGVFFEEQNIDSLKADNETLIGLHSVLAQAESENISANVRWGIQQRMKTGTFKFRYNLLGYEKGEDGEPKINVKEAEYIKTIFQMFLDGNSLDQIKEYLEMNGIKTFRGNSVWSKSTIHNILTNERYSGDMVLQKTFIENCITKKVKVNHGEMAKYLIVNNHVPIINKDTFKLVQLEIARRSGKKNIIDTVTKEQSKYSGKFAMTELLVCGCCGSPYRRRTWVQHGKSKRVWRCLNRIKYGIAYCSDSISIDEEKLKSAICRALRKALKYKDEALSLIITNLSYAITGDDETLNVYAIENQIKELNQTIDDNVLLASKTKGDKTKYEQAINDVSNQIVILREQLSLAKEKLNSNQVVKLELERIKKILEEENNPFEEYDEVIVRRIVEYIRVMSDKRIELILKGGLLIEENI